MKLTDIAIRAQYEVECPHIDCDRVIAVESRYAKAIEARRDHLETVHPASPKPVPPKRVPQPPAVCPGCERVRAVTYDGTFRNHDLPSQRRKLTRFERRSGVNPIVKQGRCPGSGRRPTT